MDVLKAVKGVTTLVGAKAEEHSPEICLGVGIVAMVGATVLACKGTIKAKKVIDETKENFEIIKETEKAGITYDDQNMEVEYTHQDAMRDRVIVTMNSAFRLTKCYGPAGVLTVAGIGLLIKGHNILRKRNLALIAAYKSISEAYKKYQDRVKEYLGETAARNLKYGLKEKEIVTDTGKKNKDGTPKVKKEKKLIFDGTDYTEFSPYARFFDEGCKGWDPDPQYSLTWLLKTQHWLNDRLKIEKVLTLNDVYDELGIPRIREGQMVGWSLFSNKDAFIDFGIYNEGYTPNRDFVNGYEPVILLDFNVDNTIYNDFPSYKDVKDERI